MLFWGVGKEEGRGNEGLSMFVESGLSSICSSNTGCVIRWLVSTKRLWTKNWRDLNFVGRKALKWWPGERGFGRRYLCPPASNYWGRREEKKKTLGKIIPTICMSDAMQNTGAGNCALQTICGLEKAWSACSGPVIWLAHFCRAHQVQTLLPSWDGAAGIWFPPWMGEEESCAVFSPEMIAFSLALLYPASLVGTASILIYHYTVSLGKQGVVWSRYIWIYHS